MHYAIRSLIKIGIEFVPVDDVNPKTVDTDYVEGAIVWSVGDVQLLSETHWDLIDQLWVYMIDGAVQFLESGTFESYFPDQPLRLGFIRRGSNGVEVTVGENKHIVDRQVFLASLIDGGKHFFEKMEGLVPKHKDTWRRYLNRIECSLAKHLSSH